MRGACILPPRAVSRPPSVVQRRFLEALTAGEQPDYDLSRDFDFSDLATVGELVLVLDAGWATARLAGFGGVVVRPPTLYGLTIRGREALAQIA
jgi:hypothetical protein